MSIKEAMTRELIPMSEQKARSHLRLVMFVMGGLLLGLGAWKMPVLDLGPSGLMVGWMALAVVVAQCIVAGLLSARYQLEKGFRINGQVAWMLVGAVIFVGTLLGLSQVEGITPAQLRLGCLLAMMMQLNCFMVGLLWPIRKKFVE
ncbi:MAG: hypothetical protein QF600_01855 [Verrucomicrobiota bacterium]|jgi:hypothetical protein|nr:hypothetical protein [Verrucomicrobiota bacterium]